MVDIPRDRGVVEAWEQIDSVRMLGLCVEALRVGVGAAGEAADEDAGPVDSARLEAVEQGVDGIEVFASDARTPILAGGAAVVFDKRPVEMTPIDEAGVLGDCFYGHAGGEESMGGIAQASAEREGAEAGSYV